MKHKIGFNRLGRKASHRKAMSRNMVTSLFQHERITTTKSKALEIRRMAEKMITRAKIDSVHNRRMIARDIKDKEILAKLFTTIGPRFTERPGGYTRILKIGQRQGDAADMVLLELVEDKEEQKTPKKKKTAAKSAKPKAEKGKTEKAATTTEEKPAETEAKSEDSKDAEKKSAAIAEKEAEPKKTTAKKADTVKKAGADKKTAESKKTPAKKSTAKSSGKSAAATDKKPAAKKSTEKKDSE